MTGQTTCIMHNDDTDRKSHKISEQAIVREDGGKHCPDPKTTKKERGKCPTCNGHLAPNSPNRGLYAQSKIPPAGTFTRQHFFEGRMALARSWPTVLWFVKSSAHFVEIIETEYNFGPFSR